MKRSVTIDLSRLLRHARTAKPSGIDRVERAYARHFLEQSEREAGFMARIRQSLSRRLDRAALARFLDRIEENWATSGARYRFGTIGKAFAGSRAFRRADGGTTIVPSHLNWHDRAWLERVRGSDGRLVLFLHDTIPADYPEYARAGGAQRHEQRLANGLAVADAFIVNSQATAEALARHARRIGAEPLIEVAPLGVDGAEPSVDFAVPSQPYFVCLGTIEPRKNHLLLLHTWRNLAEQGVPGLPQLHVVGRRGWENEQIVDLLERSNGLRGCVVEHNHLGDADIAALLKGARALLMPSFVEGFGMPVNEALAAGVPVIAGDLAVYRETAGEVPDYLDPLDGPAWARAILDYAAPGSAAREAQLGRLAGWAAPSWDDHFATLHRLLERLDG